MNTSVQSGTSSSQLEWPSEDSVSNDATQLRQTLIEEISFPTRIDVTAGNLPEIPLRNVKRNRIRFCVKLPKNPGRFLKNPKVLNNWHWEKLLDSVPKKSSQKRIHTQNRVRPVPESRLTCKVNPSGTGSTKVVWYLFDGVRKNWFDFDGKSVPAAN